MIDYFRNNTRAQCVNLVCMPINYIQAMPLYYWHRSIALRPLWRVNIYSTRLSIRLGFCRGQRAVKTIDGRVGALLPSSINMIRGQPHRLCVSALLMVYKIFICGSRIQPFLGTKKTSQALKNYLKFRLMEFYGECILKVNRTQTKWPIFVG